MNFLISQILPDTIHRFPGRLAPEVGGIFYLNMIVIYPQVNRPLCLSFKDHVVIPRKFKLGAETGITVTAPKSGE